MFRLVLELQVLKIITLSLMWLYMVVVVYLSLQKML